MADAQFQRAGLYFVDKDLENAFHWYSKAAEQGHVQAMNNLGAFYFNGHHVEKDIEKAFNLSKKAADMNNPESQYTMGTFYELGNYVKQDKKKAIEYYKKAAANGVELAKKKLETLGVYTNY